MIAVMFEFTPHAHRRGRYFDLVGEMREHLARVDGFISVERFESVTTPGKFVSLSMWRDEEALRAWRNLPEHRGVQAEGRGDVFADYRLRVAEVIREYGLRERAEAPADSRAVHDPV
jgi:heme-degrading monooxygenase HmoA